MARFDVSFTTLSDIPKNNQTVIIVQHSLNTNLESFSRLQELTFWEVKIQVHTFQTRSAAIRQKKLYLYQLQSKELGFFSCRAKTWNTRKKTWSVSNLNFLQSPLSVKSERFNLDAFKKQTIQKQIVDWLLRTVTEVDLLENW